MRTRGPHGHHPARTILTIFILTFFSAIFLVPAAHAQERVIDPAPVTNHPVELTAPLDVAGPLEEGPALTDEFNRLRDERRRLTASETPATKETAYTDEIGGDDVVVVMDDLFRNPSMDIASNGDIYLAVEKGDGDGPADIFIYRSQDGGDTWDSWGNFHSTVDQEYREPSLVVAEGTENRCYVAYSFHDGAGNFQIRLAWSDLSSTSGTWYGLTVMSDPVVRYMSPRLVADDASFSSYYLYMVAEGYDGGAYDIWFSRSIDRSATWETPYLIADMTLSTRKYWEPDIAVGYGGYVHVAWTFEYDDHSLADAALRYRRASGFASTGISSWESIQYLGSTTDDLWATRPRIEASPAGNDVLIATPQMYWLGDNSWRYEDYSMTVSHDQGASFPDRTSLPDAMIYPSDLLYLPGSGDWVMAGAGHYYAPAIQRASGAAPLVWSDPEHFIDNWDIGEIIWSESFAIDPTHGDQVAANWIRKEDPPDEPLLFDAEWRADPGYPNFEDGFPQPLDAPPVSSPALEDISGYSDLEIIWGDTVGRIHAVYDSGAYVPGFPVDTGHYLSDGGVAIGKLTLSDDLFLVVGTADGLVFCYDTAGQLVEGWPWDTGTGAAAYVSIGAVGGPYPRTIVVGSGDRLDFRNWRGERPPGAYLRTSPGRTFHAPCAIGDVDGDGKSEVVGSPGNHVFVVKMDEITGVFGKFLASDISDAVTLGDIDTDGKVEVIVPTVDGTLYAFNEDGTAPPGTWPFVSSTGSPLTSGAIAQCLGTSEPEVAVAAMNWTVHMVYFDGHEHSNYPKNTSLGWYVYGAPLIGRVDGSSSDVVVGDRGDKAWSWSNIGIQVPGWPKEFTSKINVSPAMGDIDLDGSNEIVFLSETHLGIVDVNNTPNDASRTWPMYGHDPQRTGCADCSEDLITSVPTDDGHPTRVSFTAPNPLPRSSPTVFRFELPERAAVNLEILDLRGRRVRTVMKEERGSGHHEVEWDRRDGSGRGLADGLYFARLQVRGPGLSEVQVRKIILLQ